MKGLSFILLITFLFVSCEVETEFNRFQSVKGTHIEDHAADDISDDEEDLFSDDSNDDQVGPSDSSDDSSDTPDNSDDSSDSSDDSSDTTDSSDDSSDTPDSSDDSSDTPDSSDDLSDTPDSSDDAADDGHLFKMMKLCSYARTFGPYVPVRYSSQNYRNGRLENGEAPKLPADYDTNPKYLTFSRATQITFAYKSDMATTVIPTQDAVKNHQLLASGKPFDLHSILKLQASEEIPAEIFYSFHSNSDISAKGLDVFVKVRLSYYRRTNFGGSPGIKSIESFMNQEQNKTRAVEILYNRRESAEAQSECDRLASPLMIALKGKRIKFNSPKFGMLFDIDGDGYKNLISCSAKQGTPFVTLPNKDGQVVNVNQLFGDNTIGPDGKKADNGFLALAKYDHNEDGYIDNKDSVYPHLRLWDEAKKCDGRAEQDELQTLKEAGVLSIKLKYKDIRKRDRHGNEARQVSKVETIEGFRRIFDIWFKSY